MLKGSLITRAWDDFKGKVKPGRAVPFYFHAPSPVLNSKPDVNEYYRMPYTIWVPTVCFPDLVKQMPCGISPKCEAKCTRRGRAASARIVQGTDHPELLIQARYKCDECKTSKGGKASFTAGSAICMARLNPLVRDAFPYVLTEKSGITKE